MPCVAGAQGEQMGSICFVLQMIGAKTVGQELFQRESLLLTVAVEADDLQLRGELPHHLTAHAAGHAEVLALSGDDNAAETSVALGHSVENGVALGADAGGIGGIFHVAAGEYRAALTFQCRAHG